MALLDVPEKQPPKVIPAGERIIPPRLRNPRETRLEPKRVFKRTADDLSLWADTKWWFYQPTTVDGFNVIDAAEFVIDANLNVVMFMLSSQSDANSGCTESVRNDLQGTLTVHPPTTDNPWPWLEFIVSGDQSWVDTCDSSRDHTDPLSGEWSWFANQLDANGLKF